MGFMLIIFFMKIVSMMTYIYRVQLIESTSDSGYESLPNLFLTLDTAQFSYKLLEL
jgi:hypothetical protein